MSDPTEVDGWTRWRVAENSAFEVRDTRGRVGLYQITDKSFLVVNEFRFADPAVLEMLTQHLVKLGMSRPDAEAAVEDARTFTPSEENPTDIASIPRFMRWFENTYGTHTLAAIIHDDLIVSERDGGALKSDTLSDRFFREMLRSSGVPWLKRWIMWTAVALRSRWAANGLRRASVAFWLALAVLGITCFVVAVGGMLFDWDPPADKWILLLVALALPFVSAPLWGKQLGASLIAAIAALWVLPAAAFGGLGWVIYKILEFAASVVGFVATKLGIR